MALLTYIIKIGYNLWYQSWVFREHIDDSTAQSTISCHSYTFLKYGEISRKHTVNNNMFTAKPLVIISDLIEEERV